MRSSALLLNNWNDNTVYPCHCQSIDHSVAVLHVSLYFFYPLTWQNLYPTSIVRSFVRHDSVRRKQPRKRHNWLSFGLQYSVCQMPDLRYHITLYQLYVFMKPYMTNCSKLYNICYKFIHLFFLWSKYYSSVTKIYHICMLYFVFLVIKILSMSNKICHIFKIHIFIFWGTEILIIYHKYT